MGKGPFKNYFTKNSANFELSPALLIFVNNISNSLPPSHQPKSDNLFPVKSTAKVCYTIPHTRFQLPISSKKNTITCKFNHNCSAKILRRVKISFFAEILSSVP